MVTYHFLKAAKQGMLSWRASLQPTVGVGLTWAGYLTLSDSVRHGIGPAWQAVAASWLLWPSVLVCSIGFLVASAKSELPALAALAAAVGLFACGALYEGAAALYFALAAGAFFFARKWQRQPRWYA